MPPSLCARTSAEARNPCSASSAAMRPESAPRDWWNLMVGVPQWAKVPADWLPARPKALRWRSASRPRSLLAADDAGLARAAERGGERTDLLGLVALAAGDRARQCV